MIQVNKSPKVVKKIEKIAKIMHMDLIREGREIYLKTAGSSMYPFLQGCDRLKIVPLEEKDIKIGDVVAIDNEGKSDAWFCVHRVISIARNRENGKKIYITKGDANREGIDEPVGFEKIIGKLIEVERNGIKINYESPIWNKYLNRKIAHFSFRNGRKLRRFAPYINIFLEKRFFNLDPIEKFFILSEIFLNFDLKKLNILKKYLVKN